MERSCELYLSADKGQHAYLVQCVMNNSQYLFAFSSEENSEALDRSALNDGRSTLAMFLTVLFKVEDFETE